MPLPVIAGTVRCTVAGDIDGGGRWSNTWHARTIDEAEPGAIQMSDLKDDLATFYSSAGLDLCTLRTTLDVIAITPLDGASGAIVYSMALVGGGGFNSLPPEVSECLTIRTLARGRQNRGRVFLPAWQTNQVDSSGVLLAAAAGVAIAAANALLASAAGHGWNIGVASYGKSVNRAGVVHTWTPHFTDASSFTMDLMLDVQRSRKR